MVRNRLLVLILSATLAGAAEPNWKRLLDREDWFGLRDAASAHAAPDLYAGALAAVFHRETDAIRILRAVVARSPMSRDADTARTLLVDIHYRSGRYRSALAELKPLLDRHPTRRDLLEALPLFTALSLQGDMEVVSRAPARVPWRVVDGNLFLPVVVNGVSGEYLLDTGANISVLGVSEARRLGLQVQGAGATTKDYTGSDVAFQAAVAPELHLGPIVLHNVPFAVVPDKQQPFVDLPQGQRGILGIPILLAAGTWRWSSDGNLEAGFAPADYVKGRENLAFSGANPVLLAEFEKTPLTFHLDTGATSTDLWPPFARRYHARLSRPGKARIGGVGGSKDIPSARLDTFDLLIAGRPIQLQNVKVLLKPVAGHPRHYGNLGLDLFEKAQRVTLDFEAMRLTVENQENQ